jgi:transcriptional regulator with XRE-family HTH domain
MQAGGSEAEALLGAIGSLLPYSNGHAAAVLRRALRELVADDGAEPATVPPPVRRANGAAGLSRELETAEQSKGGRHPADGKPTKTAALAEAGISTSTRRTAPAAKRRRPGPGGSVRRSDPSWSAVRQQLREAMAERDVTQAQLAGVLGLTPTSVARYLSVSRKARVPDVVSKTKLISWLNTPQPAVSRVVQERSTAETDKPERGPPPSPALDPAGDWPELRDAVKARIAERGLGRGRAADEMRWSLASLNHCMGPTGKAPPPERVSQLRAWLQHGSTTTAPAVASSGARFHGSNGAAAAA